MDAALYAQKGINNHASEHRHWLGIQKKVCKPDQPFRNWDGRIKERATIPTSCATIHAARELIFSVFRTLYLLLFYVFTAADCKYCSTATKLLMVYKRLWLTLSEQFVLIVASSWLLS